MNRTEINIGLCSILETLDEMPDGWSPRSILHMALESRGLDPAVILSVAEQGRLVVLSPEIVTITDAGRKIAAKSREFTAAAKAVRS